MVSIIEAENPKFSKLTVDTILEKRLKGKVTLSVLDSTLKAMYPNDSQKQNDLFSEILVENKANTQLKKFFNKLTSRKEGQRGSH